MKKLVTLLGVAVGLLLPAVAEASAGVAFVHGTGSQDAALEDYWTRELVDSVRMGLPNPNNYTVINCDFTQALWDERASGCLAEELSAFVEVYDIDELVVITHSHGGNMMRWIMSNPTYDPRYPVILDALSWVNALAPSSLGTPLADAALAGNKLETTLGGLLGYDTMGVAQQRPANMASLNANWLYGTEGRPALPKGFWAVVGTDVESSVFDGDSYCGGYALNVGLELTQNWLDDCSDGFLDCSSQGGAGKVWAYDTQFTEDEEPLSHAQSRRACFGLDDLLRSDLESL